MSSCMTPAVRARSTVVGVLVLGFALLAGSAARAGDQVSWFDLRQKIHPLMAACLGDAAFLRSACAVMLQDKARLETVVLRSGSGGDGTVHFLFDLDRAPTFRCVAADVDVGGGDRLAETRVSRSRQFDAILTPAGVVKDANGTSAPPDATWVALRRGIPPVLAVILTDREVLRRMSAVLLDDRARLKTVIWQHRANGNDWTYLLFQREGQDLLCIAVAVVARVDLESHEVWHEVRFVHPQTYRATILADGAVQKVVQ
ncbi:MAG: hypothetical protein HY815_14995 [Candidatus Riflebacteria bacterium]|nr:hypothetical protein [Candidatus Riflebacteria bacterium]